MHALINGTRVHYACYLVVSAPPPHLDKIQMNSSFSLGDLPLICRQIVKSLLLNSCLALG